MPGRPNLYPVCPESRTIYELLGGIGLPRSIAIFRVPPNSTAARSHQEPDFLPPYFLPAPSFPSNFSITLFSHSSGANPSCNHSHLPSAPTIQFCGTPNAGVSPFTYRDASNTGNEYFFSFIYGSTSPIESSTLIEITAMSFRSFTLSYSACKYGCSPWHGPHHVAHILISTVLPFSSLRLQVFPFKSVSFASGNSFDTRSHPPSEAFFEPAAATSQASAPLSVPPNSFHRRSYPSFASSFFPRAL